ncbi:MAG TPA: zinc-binding dehydrogenase [Puia sp.]|nr:zinc-binding dehydrogenase [Puia sp.]
MKAILVSKPGGAENLIIRTVPLPTVMSDQVLIEVKAFGINHAEIYMREGNWPEIANIIGIECVGIVQQDPSGKFKPGQKVATLMGGMGRSINGSYAQLTCVRLTNVVALESELDWPTLASIPESFASAWGALFPVLKIEAGESLLIRGATSAFGQAACILAKQKGLTVIATTRSEEKKKLLYNLGANHVIIDRGKISQEVRKIISFGVDKVLELVGSTTLRDTISSTARTGTVCMAGFLGGRTQMDKLQPQLEWILKKKGNNFGLHIPGLPKIAFFASSAIGTTKFPISKIPFQQFVDDTEQKKIPSILSHVFRFDEISRAHQHMEQDGSMGKIVVLGPGFDDQNMIN